MRIRVESEETPDTRDIVKELEAFGERSEVISSIEVLGEIADEQGSA